MMTKFMISFGDVRLEKPMLTKAMNLFVTKILMNDESWPATFDQWSPDGNDWGIMSSSSNTTVSSISSLMKKYAFQRSHSGFMFRFDLIHVPRIPEEWGSIPVAESQPCIICFESISEAAKIPVLPCGHLFHPDCIMAWLVIQSSCPHCRRDPYHQEDLLKHGNEAAGASEHRKAQKLYSQCLCELDASVDRPQLRSKLITNLALMHLRLEEWEYARQYATRALELPSSSLVQRAKAFYRRGIANQHLQNWKAAQADLNNAQELEPEDKAIQRALANLRTSMQKTEHDL